MITIDSDGYLLAKKSMSDNNQIWFSVVGGPHDGMRFSFSPDAPVPKDVLYGFEHNADATARIGEHKYRIVEFSSETMEGVLMW